LLLHFSLNKKLVQSLKPYHYKLLYQGLESVILSIEKIMQNPQMSEIMPEIMEEEWSKFKFVDQHEMEQIAFSNLIVLPVLDEKVGRKIPLNLVYPSKDVDMARMQLRQLFTLRHLLFYLSKNDDQLAHKIRERPVPLESRAVQKWEESQIYEIEPNNELILCNVRLSGKMYVRYVLLDPEFFILVEPDFSQNDEYRVKIHTKISLKQVESLVDRIENRNLCMAFAHF
jgi:hypothetical protein